MPDHVHLLLEGTAEDSHLPPFVARAKQHAALEFSIKFRYCLWQPGFHERVLRDDEPTFEVIRYTINNPVRAGLVDDPRHYPFWGSGVWTRDQLLDFIAIEPDGRWRS